MTQGDSHRSWAETSHPRWHRRAPKEEGQPRTEGPISSSGSTRALWPVESPQRVPSGRRAEAGALRPPSSISYWKSRPWSGEHAVEGSRRPPQRSAAVHQPKRSRRGQEAWSRDGKTLAAPSGSEQALLPPWRSCPGRRPVPPLGRLERGHGAGDAPWQDVHTPP